MIGFCKDIRFHLFLINFYIILTCYVKTKDLNSYIKAHTREQILNNNNNNTKEKK